MTSKNLSEVLGDARRDSHQLSYDVPQGWTQGRTAYGGFTAALLLDAATRQNPDLPPLRSALINFTAPVSDSLSIGSEVLRQGRNITTIGTRGEIGGKPAAVATFSFGRAQESHISVGMAPPKAPAPEDTAPVPEAGQGLTPLFFQNFDFHPLAGAPPFSGAEKGYLRAWVRHRDPQARDLASGLLCLADMLPPAIFPMLNTPGPNSSVNWICNILSDAPGTRDGWYMTESTISAGANGYSSQVMRMWNTEGELVVDGMQSVVIFV